MNLRHIAKLAGVSPSAVSLALRDSPRISSATKQKVMRVAKETGYAPDAKIVDLMRHLRGSTARRHVREEIPFYTGRRISPEDGDSLLQG